MRKHLGNSPILLVAAAAAVTLLAGTAGCSDDGEDTDTPEATTAETPTTEGTGTTSEDTNGTDTDADGDASDAFPSDAFCDAAADFAAAQDGAQRNTAIVEMQEAAGDAPAEITDALDTLLTGDLEPEAYTSASQTIEDACE